MHPVEAMPTLLPAAFVVLVVFVLPLAEWPGVRRLRQFTSSAARISHYRATVAVLWTVAIAAGALAWPQNLFALRRADADMAWLLIHPAIMLAVAAIVAGYFVLAIGQGLRCIRDTRLRARTGRAMRTLRFMLPVSAPERRWWVAVSIAAGVCEELFYRGYLMQFLRGPMHLDLTAAWLASALAFGVGHAYQGAAGIVRTTLAGLLFGLVAIFSGGLVLPIVLHVVADLQALWMYRPEQDDPDEAERLVRGCTGAPSGTETAGSSRDFDVDPLSA